jgi:hypothetical protein
MPGRRPPSTISFEHKPGTACKEARYHRRCAGRWRGIIELAPTHDGKRVRKKVSAGTRAEVEVKLEAVRVELAKGVRPRAGYTLNAAMEDWFDHGLPGRVPKTISTYREATGR